MLNRLLFSKIDNGSLVLFRIFFGLLISFEGFGAIATGWVRRTLIEPKFTFNFIGFEWLQPLPGNGMYLYFAIMGTLGLLIALGYKYRYAMIAFALMWSGVYLMQKSSYNNHYYLLALISVIMCFFPANRAYSLDAKLNPEIRTDSMYAYVKWIVVLQLFLVYTYASVAKLYGDWLDFTFIDVLMRSKSDYFLIGGLLQETWFQKVIGISGILFDLLIIPALLWKPTRLFAFIVSIFFHLFNSFVFQIGIFPYLALAFTVFFFSPETIKKRFLSNKTLYSDNEIIIPSYRKILLLVGGTYFIIQFALPLRHHFFQDDVLWTEEGHRLSWRMMLRSRNGTIQFRLVNRTTGKSEYVKLEDYLTKKQRRKVASYPDFMWQFAQHLKKEYAAKGEEISVFARSRVRINDHPYRTFIDPKTDLANVPWHHLKHHNWILPSNFSSKKKLPDRP
ncbi:HTTM domain-containing protein [Poritiphilus flavus]|uniref:HTTM domain-containing protein n=1 Tax=Poritiphilus flavus TaxID=2697053 RepID=A0A6L9E7R6_9FLAO|nr:HTTM domain-containing protein [Poritiphilus flavus]NAS10648.1 HTTM domain-containing protein [Poritiphilus flavus]